MKFSDFLNIINEYREIFMNHYYLKNDQSSISLLNHTLNNKINNYVDYINFSLILKNIDTVYRKNNKTKILDLGCGVLDKSFILRKFYPYSKIYGVETKNPDDYELIKLNKTRFNRKKFFSLLNSKYNIKFYLYNGKNLPFADNYFNVILLYAVLEHVKFESRKSFIRTIQKKLKVNGLIIVTRCPQKYGFFEQISEKLLLGAHKWRLTEKEIYELFPSSKYKIIEIKKVNNIFTEPTTLTNRIFYLLIIIDKVLALIKWPFFSDYFLAIKKLS